MTPTWQRILWGTKPRRTFWRAVVLAIFSALFFGLVLRPLRVEGISMYPTLTSGTLHWANLVRYRFTDPKRGDLVVIGVPGHHILYLKRVLGLPGETIEFRGGKVHINGEPLDENYLRYSRAWTMDPVRLGHDEYFVCGDNRTMSMEDHRLGTVERRNIVGEMAW